MAHDRIVKSILLPAPRARVWEALGNSANFGKWFGMELDGPFAAGREMTGRIRPTEVDEEVARMQAPYAGLKVTFHVVAVEPEKRLSLRWHPFAIDPAVDYSAEPTTLIEFTLEDEAGGTRLTVTESGFDRIPLARRAKAFEANSGGWELQMRLISRFVAGQR